LSRELTGLTLSNQGGQIASESNLTARQILDRIYVKVTSIADAA
jgi:hypothetical protein